MDLYTSVILEFSDIRKPLFIRHFSVKIPVQVILRDVCRIVAVLCTAFRFPLDRGLNVSYAAEAQNSFVVDADTMPFLQFVSDPPIPHLRMVFMDIPDLFRDLGIVFLA